MRAAWALVLMCAVGCDDHEEDPRSVLDARVPDASIDARVGLPDSSDNFGDASPPNPQSFVWFMPVDNSRLAADGGLGLSVSAFTPTRSREDSLRELADALELVRWPSAERLPTQVRYDAVLADYATQVTVLPEQPLAEGRYALRLKQDLPRARFNPFELAPREQLPTSRFYVGSDPVVRRIEVCDKGARTKLTISLSEPVHGGTVAVFAGETPLQCEASPDLGAWLELLCAPIAAKNLRVRFTGFASDTGVPLENEAGGAPDYSFSLVGLSMSSCPTYVPY